MLRAAGNTSEAEEWALVLARAVLEAYDQEARSDAAVASHEPAWRVISWTIGALVGAGLIGFFVITGSPAPGARWFERGGVLAASTVLLAMLGTGRGSDELAHALGLASGMALGLAAAVVVRRPLGTAVQWALVGLTFFAVVGCWRSGSLRDKCRRGGRSVRPRHVRDDRF